jgi:hypothetical protein
MQAGVELKEVTNKQRIFKHNTASTNDYFWDKILAVPVQIVRFQCLQLCILSWSKPLTGHPKSMK